MSDLFEPIEGVTIELYGELQAKRTGGLPEADFVKLLGQHGMDLEKFARVEKGWNDRMSADATATVATKYSMAFTGAGQGGAGGAAAAAVAGMQMQTDANGMMTGITPGAPSGAADPCTFERYVEMMAAQTVWATTGQDVNAMLKETFGIDAMEYANIGTHWSMKMATDMSLAEKLGTLMPQLEQKYRDQAGGGADDDLEF